MTVLNIIKNLIAGFWEKGFVSLCKVVLEHWILSFLIVILIAYLCSDSETAIYAWFLIGIFAVYSALKAFIDIIVGIRIYVKLTNIKHKALILQKTGGKIFDFVLCAVGIFQALRIFSHISKITKSTSSAINVVDDVAGAISKFLKNIQK